MEWLTDPQAWIALVTLTALEIVLGIDNIIFISILSSKLPGAQQKRAQPRSCARNADTHCAAFFADMDHASYGTAFYRSRPRTFRS